MPVKRRGISSFDCAGRWRRRRRYWIRPFSDFGWGDRNIHPRKASVTLVRTTSSSPLFAPLAALVTLLALGASCAPKHHVMNGPSLAGIGAPLATIDDGPFRLVYGGPKSEVTSSDGNVDVTLAFSRPVREGVQPATLRAQGGKEIEGTWSWFGESTAVFAPKAPLPRATTFTVEPSGAIIAKDGSPIGDRASIAPFSFTTQRPALTSVSYEYDEEHKQHIVYANFNQDVIGKTVKEALRIEGRGGVKVPFRILEENPRRRGAKDDKSEFTLIADPNVGRLEDVHVIASTAIRSEEGDVPPSAESRLPLEGTGPFRVNLECMLVGKDETAPIRLPLADKKTPRCEFDRGSIALELTRSVKSKDLLRRISVAPPAKLNPDEVKSFVTLETTTRVDLQSLIADFAPGQRYKVIVKGGLEATDKERLTTDQVIEFETNDLPPSIGFRDVGGLSDVTVESARANIPLHVHTTNIPSLKVAAAPLLTDQDLADVLFPNEKSPVDVDFVRHFPKSVSVTVPIDGKKNEGTSTKLTVAPERTAGQSGAYVVALRAAGEKEQHRVFTVTDLGVTTKWSPHGGLVWVTRLSTAEPIAGASISVRRVWPGSPAEMQEAFATMTDKDGLATIPSQVVATFLRAAHDADDATKKLTSARPLLLVRHGSDGTYIRPPELDPSLLPAIGYMFVERGLYRPGENVFVKGYFRTPSPRGLLTLAGKTAYVEAIDGDGKVFLAATATLDAFGSFSTTLAIPKNVRLGFAWARARLGVAPPPRPRHGEHAGRWRAWRYDHSWPASDRFTIDEFRTPEFKVVSRTDKSHYVRGETAKLVSTANYLLGAPMTQVPVNIGVSRSRTTFTPPGLESFSTALAVALESKQVRDEDKFEGVRASVPLDNAGRAAFQMLLPQALTTQPHSYTFEVGVPDITRAFTVGDDVSVTVHPSNVYLGVRIKREDEKTAPVLLIPGKSVRVELVSADIDGTRRGGIATKLELLAPNKKDKDSWTPTSRTCTLTTDAEKVAACELALTDEGTHHIRATAVDASGHAIAASTSFDVLPKDTKPPLPPPPPPKPIEEAIPRVDARGRELSFDERCAQDVTSSPDVSIPLLEMDRGLHTDESGKTQYVVGDTARLCLRGAWRRQTARGLFTLEREGILDRSVFHDMQTRGRVKTIPITGELHPNVTATLTEIGARTSGFPTSERIGDHGHPTASSSQTSLSVRAPGKALSVEIEPPGDARPGSDVELRLKVTDGNKHETPAQITVWAIDEGIELLVPKSPPRPNETFEDERSADVTDDDNRSRIFFEHVGMHSSKAPSLRAGATSVSPSSLFGRSVFRPTAFFLANVITDKRGAATVRARLPDNLTNWKVTAVAATAGDSFGVGVSSFKTNKPLMVRPELPRFMRTGDRIEATAMIDSLAKEPIDVDVTMSTRGVFGKTTKSSRLRVAEEGHVPIRFPLEAKAVGTGVITFHVRSKDHVDEVTIDEEVKSLASVETVLLTGEIAASESPSITNVRTGALSKARADVGGFDYRLSTTPLVGLAESINDLIEYPYGCTEQLTSRLLPLVQLRGMARDLNATLPPNIDGMVRSSLSALLSHQREDGGFGFWQGSRKSEPWLTVLALRALHVARQNGYTVPQSSIDEALAWLEKPTEPDEQHLSQRKDVTLDAGSRAMLEDLLATLGKPRASELRALANDPHLPLFGQALVAHALARLDRDLAAEVLARIVTKAKTTAALTTFDDEPNLAWRSHLSSNARTTAMVLRAMVAIDPRHPLVTKTVRGLLSFRREGRWPTTQASAWALMALEDARPLYAPRQARTTASFLFDGRTLTHTSFAGAPGGETTTGTLPMSRLLAAPDAAFGFESDGKRPLFYEGTLRYARSEPPMTPLDRGLSIARSLRPREPGAREIRVGDYVTVDVVIATMTSRDLVVVDDPIPSGFEAVNHNFANRDRGAPAVVDPSARDLSHRELRDDRVVSFYDALPPGVHITRYTLRAIVPGHFALPPAKVECMYAPDVFGRTATSWIDVR